MMFSPSDADERRRFFIALIAAYSRFFESNARIPLPARLIFREDFIDEL